MIDFFEAGLLFGFLAVVGIGLVVYATRPR